MSSPHASPAGTLAEPKKAPEITRNLYRFELSRSSRARPAASPSSRNGRDLNRLGITSFDLPTLLTWRQEGKLSDAVVQAYRDAAARQSLVNDSELAIADIDRQVQAVSQDQSRIRQNMQTVDRNTDLYRRYATKLNDQESSLEALATRRADEQQKLDQRRADLANFLKSLNAD